MSKCPVMTSSDTCTNPGSWSKTFGYLTPKLREQRQQKFGSQSSIESGPKIPTCGLSTLESMTGTSAGQRRGKSLNLRPKPPKGCNPLFFSTFRFCLFLIFAASITQITVASHNLHLFKKSAAYHKSCLKNYGGIWFGQELWLSEKQLPKLQELEAQFVARSGMENAVSSGILSGRPFGGVSIAWSPDLDHSITPISDFRHKRAVGIEFKAEDGNYLLLNVYMPFFDSANRTECMIDTIDTLAMIETILEQFADYFVIIGGDMNTEFKENSPFDPLWTEVMTKFELACCDNSFPSSTITYQHNSLGHRKWNDHFLLSRKLVESASLSNHQVLVEGDNLSDHFPIMMSLKTKIQSRPFEAFQPPTQRKLKWDKVSESHKDAYSNQLNTILASQHFYAPLYCQNRCQCRDSRCEAAIQQEYDFLISSMQSADSSLPHFKPGVEKDWWTDGLTRLRHDSIEIQNL